MKPGWLVVLTAAELICFVHCSPQYFVKRQAPLDPKLDVTIGVQCVLNGRTFKSGSAIIDGCLDCLCKDGIVQCRFLRKITDGCLYFENRESTTPPPNGCKFEGSYHYDGEVFVAKDGCNKCWCNKSELLCPYEDECANAVGKRRSFEK